MQKAAVALIFRQVFQRGCGPTGCIRAWPSTGMSHAGTADGIANLSFLLPSRLLPGPAVGEEMPHVQLSQWGLEEESQQRTVKFHPLSQCKASKSQSQSSIQEDL